MASRSINDLHPMLAYAFGKAEQKWRMTRPNAPVPFLTATFRSKEEQATLYAQGRTTKGAKVTNAKPGQSAHNYQPSFAFDVGFKYPSGVMDWDNRLFDQFAPMVLETAGITWGGHFKSIMDRPHFELTGWETMPKV